MDEKLLQVINQKINQVFENADEIKTILESLDELSSDKNSFAFGIVIGRLYNSFYYQSRRILKRDPTKEEFSEFVELLKNYESKFLTEL